MQRFTARKTARWVRRAAAGGCVGVLLALAAPSAATAGATGTCTTTQLVANPGFESGKTAWTASGWGGIISQYVGTYDGRWGAWLDGSGQTETDVLTQQVKVPTGCNTVTVRFALHVISSDASQGAADVLRVKLAGATLAQFSNHDNGSSYVIHTATLKGLAGHTVTLELNGQENNSAPTSFFLDDVTATAST